jgi:hypothetical protein
MTSQRRGASIVAALLIASGCGAAAANDAIAQRVSTGSGPTIDGVVGEAEWADAAGLPPFISVDTRMVPVEPPASVLLKYDTANLYIALRSRMDFDPEITPVPHDTTETRGIDSLEITLCKPGEQAWYKFVIERGGGKAEVRYQRWDVQPYGDWNPPWEYRSRVLPEAFLAGALWEAELAIPWATLAMTAPTAALAFPAQFVRFHGNTRFSATPSISAWGKSESVWDLPNPDLFGTLLFVPEKRVFRFGLIENFGKGRGGVMGELSQAGAGCTVAGRVWHVSDYQRTYLDEQVPVADRRVEFLRTIDVAGSVPAMWTYTVSDADGVVGRNQGHAVIRPPFYADIAPLFPARQLVCLAATTLETVPPGARVRLEARGAAGNVLTQAEQTLPPGRRWAELTTAMPDSSASAAAMLVDAAGSVLYTTALDIAPVERDPSWMDRHPGALDTPPPPWSPITLTEAAGTVRVGIFKHEICFGTSPLPDAIRLFGDGFSAAPWRVVAVVDGREVRFEAVEPLRISARDGRGATLAYRGAAASLTLRAEIRIEFDGLAWYRVELAPKTAPVTVERLALDVPLAATGLRYVRASASLAPMTNRGFAALICGARAPGSVPTPEMTCDVGRVADDGWIAKNSFFHSYWIGGEDRGVYVLFPSTRNLAVAGDYVTTAETDQRLELAFNLIDHPTRVTAVLDYEFGVMITPAKPVTDWSRLRKVGQFFPDGEPPWQPDYTRATKVSEQCRTESFADRFMWPQVFPQIPYGYFAAQSLPCWTLRDNQSGNPRPSPANIVEIDRHLDGIRRSLGGRATLWYDSLCTTLTPAHATPFLQDFETYPATHLPIETYATLTCAAGSWPDYYLSGVEQRLRQGVSSFYMDMSGIRACTNRFHNCGWRDESGATQATMPFLAVREQFLRMQKLVKEHDPDGLLLLHGGAASPLTAWVDVNVYGEEWTTAPNYATLSMGFFQLHYMNTRQLGTVNHHFAGLLYKQYPIFQRSGVIQEECWGMALLHGETLYTVNGVEIAGNMMVWQALDAFQADAPDTAFIPYWRNELSAAQVAEVRISTYQREGRELLVVFNTAYGARPVRLNGRTLTDALHGGNAAVEFELKPRGFRLLVAERAADPGPGRP